ncbi:MAG TPA: hypothetical protein VGC41_24435 [Kofleriaceae bacterium]
MSKKKKKKLKKHGFRNAGGKTRNAAPSAPRPRSAKAPEDPLTRLAWTAGGAAGAALAGSLLARQGWAPKTVATAMTAVGAGLAWKGDGDRVRDLGTGVMSASGSQLALMIIDDRDVHKAPPEPQVVAIKKPANAGALPPGSLEAALERAKARLALEEREQE